MIAREGYGAALLAGLFFLAPRGRARRNHCNNRTFWREWIRVVITTKQIADRKREKACEGFVEV